MQFNSIDFFLFFPEVCIVYFALPWVKARNAFLLCASYYFYMNWEPMYALLLLACTVITYFTGLAIERYAERKRLWLTIGISLNLGILGFYKYFEFIGENVTTLLKAMHVEIAMPHFALLLPVGISFFTFQALGYAIDVYRGDTSAVKNFFRYALFVSFFPQLVAGPIERPKNLLPQFEVKHRFEYDSVMTGAWWMLWGYFMKLAIADVCGGYVDSVYDNLQQHNGGSYAVAALLFPFQIYGDFAGYSLVAIGAAKVMGFNLMENFRRPFFASSVSEFWRRWHISLSSWFMDYVYIPLGGSRKGKTKTCGNLIATFCLSGLWHGANWTFVIWGLIHGIAVSIEHFFKIAKKSRSGFSRFIGMLITFAVFALSMVFFRSRNVEAAIKVIKGIFTNPGIPFMGDVSLMILPVSFMILLIKELRDEFSIKLPGGTGVQFALRHSVIVFLISFILLFGVLEGPQFIYFQF